MSSGPHSPPPKKAPLSTYQVRVKARLKLPTTVRDPFSRWCEQHNRPWVNYGAFCQCPTCHQKAPHG